MAQALKLTGSYIKAGDQSESHQSLSDLSKHRNPAVRRRIAENPRTAPEILATLATDAVTEVRSALAWNAAVEMNVLEGLCHDEDVNVRLALTENQNLPERLLQLLANDENPYVQHHAKRALEVIALEAQLKSEGFKTKEGPEARLGELLVAAGIVDTNRMNALIEAAKAKKLPLGHVLIIDGGISQSVVINALRLQYQVRKSAISLEQAIIELRAMR